MTSPRGEIGRIVGLPRADYTRGQFHERAHLAELRLRRWRDKPDEWVDLTNAPSLLPDQRTFLAACIASARQPPTDQGRRGVLGFMSCGSGKTLSLQLAPRIFGARRPILVTEANLLPQLRADIARWGGRFDLAEPEVVSYGKLSHPTGANLLDALAPDLIMCDEGHKIGKGARSKRLWEYVDERRDTVVIIVSGSLMSRSVFDISDAAALTLREGSPLPFNPSILDHWASVLDAGGEFGPLDADALRPLIQWRKLAGPSPVPEFAGDFRGEARDAFRVRLQTCPGVVVTSGPLDVGASLSLRMVDPIPSPELDELEQSWTLPDGTELVDMLEFYRHARTLRLGFWYRFRPDTVDDEWMGRRRQWWGVVRDHVDSGYYQTPYFVVDAAERTQLSRSAMVAYHRWVEVRSRVAPPERETIWTSEGRERLLGLVARWRQNSPRGVVWYHSRALEGLPWGCDLVRAADAPPTSSAPPPVTMSLAHRQGWNGQGYSRALVLEPPTSAREMEQLLARHHRRGQSEDVEFALVGTARDRSVLSARATAVFEMTGAPQRFLLADWLGGVTP